nr:hypothetical protein [Parachlamydiaceae bacterium]
QEKNLILEPNINKIELDKSQRISSANLGLIVKNAAEQRTYKVASENSDGKKPNMLVNTSVTGVSLGLASLVQLIKDDPKFFNMHPEFNQYAKTLTETFNIKKEILSKHTLSPEGEADLLKDLQYISNAVRLIETELTHRVEVEALLKPGSVNSRAASRDLELKSKELQQIIDSLKEAYENGTKLVQHGKDENAKIETKKRRPTFIGKPLTEGASRQAANTYESIISKIENLPKDSRLKNQAKQIVGLMGRDTRFNAICKKNHKLEMRYKNIAGQLYLEKEAPKVQVQISLDEVLKVPVNPDIQKEFLSTYRSYFNETPGDNDPGPADQKLFSLLIEKFNDSETSLYEKQQVLKLAIEWTKVNTPTTLIMPQISMLEDFAALNGSPTLNALGETLNETLNRASPK